MTKFTFVIGRQYGAGGRKLGQAIAKLFDIPYYDRELLSEAAETLGMSKELFDRTDERRPSLIRSLLSFQYGSLLGDFSSITLTDENIYAAQSKVIRHIGDKGPCVIVGRTADYVLRNNPNVISIFVHSPLDIRAATIMERGECDDLDEARLTALKRDRQRQDYYNFYTNRAWGQAENYDLTWDSSRISLETILDFLSLYSQRN